MERYAVIAIVTSFLLTAALIKVLIPLLTRLKLGQRILEIGPSWHAAKSGTPTMGGIAFLVTALAVCGVFSLILGGREGALLITVTLYAFANGIIGLTDDAVKMKKRQNEGLTAFAKYLLQLIAAAGFIVALRVLGFVSTELYIPFFAVNIDIGALYYPFALLMLTGFVNAVNLTDGLDGLCASVSAVVALFFAMLFFREGNTPMSAFSFVPFSVCLAFLIYNFHPAKIFMGDTGSLFIGGAVSGMSLASGKNTVLIIVGVMYLVEAVSVILQVIYYKLTKKRLFLMAPIHHHFEKKGKSEVKITAGFTLVTAAASVIALIFA